jgi:hypothetical protein
LIENDLPQRREDAERKKDNGREKAQKTQNKMLLRRFL